MSLSITSHTTGWLAHTATAAQVQAALEALAPIGAGTVVVSAHTAPYPAYTVMFQGALATTDVLLLRAESALTPSSLRILVTEEQRGGPLANERQQIAFSQTPTGGQWRLTYLSAANIRRRETQMALDWIEQRLKTDVALTALIPVRDIFIGEGPLSQPHSLPVRYVQVMVQSAQPVIVIGGHRIAEAMRVQIKVVERTPEMSADSELVAQRIDELFQNVAWASLNDGYVASCTKDESVSYQERPRSDAAYQHRGGVFALTVQHDHNEEE